MRAAPHVAKSMAWGIRCVGIDLAISIVIPGGNMSDDPDMTDIVCALANYLRDNPLACDTADGISRWWLAAQSESTEKLLQALDWMKREGLVEEMVATDGRLRYRRRATDEQLHAIACRKPRNAASHRDG
jgi:hypothetical protein